MNDYNKYTDQELNNWEREIFGERLNNGKTFKDYLILQEAWVVNKKYKSGAVRDPIKYMELEEKWACLQSLRHRREKAKKHELNDLEKIAEQEEPMSQQEPTPESTGACETDFNARLDI